MTPREVIAKSLEEGDPDATGSMAASEILVDLAAAGFTVVPMPPNDACDPAVLEQEAE